MKSRDINLISLEEKLDTSSAAGELVFHVFGAIAHFERRLISERTRDGIAAARKRGSHFFTDSAFWEKNAKYNPRPRALFPYYLGLKANASHVQKLDTVWSKVLN